MNVIKFPTEHVIDGDDWSRLNALQQQWENSYYFLKRSYADRPDLFALSRERFANGLRDKWELIKNNEIHCENISNTR